MERTRIRLRGEYLEMPGLRLTSAQLQRFCAVDAEQIQVVLEELVKEGFLVRRPDGAYTRVGDGPTFPAAN